MGETFDIQSYMTWGVENIVKSSLRAVIRNPRESAFMMRFAAAARRASKKERRKKKQASMSRRSSLPASLPAATSTVPGVIPDAPRRQLTRLR